MGERWKNGQIQPETQPDRSSVPRPLRPLPHLHPPPPHTPRGAPEGVGPIPHPTPTPSAQMQHWTQTLQTPERRDNQRDRSYHGAQPQASGSQAAGVSPRLRPHLQEQCGVGVPNTQLVRGFWEPFLPPGRCRGPELLRPKNQSSVRPQFTPPTSVYPSWPVY